MANDSKTDRVACPHCGNDYNVRANQKTQRCNGCDRTLKILRDGKRIWLEEQKVFKSSELRTAEDNRDGIG